MLDPSFPGAGEEPLRRLRELPPTARRAEGERGAVRDDGDSPVHLDPHAADRIADHVSDIAYAPVLQPQHSVRHLPDALVVADHYDGSGPSRPLPRAAAAGDLPQPGQ